MHQKPKPVCTIACFQESRAPSEGEGGGGGIRAKRTSGEAEEGYSGLARRLQTRPAMSPCHRHGNAVPADSLGLIGSCQGNDKMNAAV